MMLPLPGRLFDSLLALLVGAVVAGMLTTGCMPASSAPGSPSKVEEALLAVAQGVKLADTTCANAGLAMLKAGKKDEARALVTLCANAVDKARAALIMAERDQARSFGQLACDALPAVDALAAMVNGLQGSQQAFDTAISDALMVASSLTKVATCSNAADLKTDGGSP